MKRLFLIIVLSLMVSGLACLGPAYAQTAGDTRFVFTDPTAKDTVTGLVWTLDANPAGKGLSWPDVYFFIKDLNRTGYGGCDSWRVPEFEELETLLDFSKQKGVTKGFDDFLNSAGFRNVKGRYYWTAYLVWIGQESEPGRKILNLYSGAEDEAALVATLTSLDNYLWPVCSVRK